MRFKMYFQLENNILDIEYRKALISFIKKSLQEYDENLYHQLYNNKDCIKKSFCFAPILSHPKFTQEKIELSNPTFQIVFSIYNYSYGLHLYNSFLNQKFKKFSLNKNSMTLVNISLIPEKEIKQNSINIKLSSPLICRNHNKETKKDTYYSFEKKDKFDEYIKINILQQMKLENLDGSILNGFEINPINAKKTVIPLYEKMIECSIGIFNIKGQIDLLNYLYRAGIGSKKAMGFGLFEII